MPGASIRCFIWGFYAFQWYFCIVHNEFNLYIIFYQCQRKWEFLRMPNTLFETEPRRADRWYSWKYEWMFQFENLLFVYSLSTHIQLFHRFAIQMFDSSWRSDLINMKIVVCQALCAVDIVDTATQLFRISFQKKPKI